MQLTEKGKKVLYGLVADPDATDEEIGRKWGIKRSTVTAIRHKLLKEEYYKEYNVPDFEQIGCEFLAVMHGDYNPLTPFELRKRQAQEVQKFFRHVYGLSTDTDRVIFSAERNFTEFNWKIIEAEKIYDRMGFLGGSGTNYAIFPFKLTTTLKTFNYADLLKEHFGFEYEVGPKLLTTKGKADLSMSDKRILYNLVRFPSASDSTIGTKARVSRQSVNNFRKRCLDERILWKSNIPNLGKLGFQLMTFTHMQPTAHVSRKQEKTCMKTLLESSSHTGIWWSGTNIMMLSAFRDYSEVQETHRAELSRLKEIGIIAKEPTVRVFPIKNLSEMSDKLDYAPMMRHVLGLED